MCASFAANVAECCGDSDDDEFLVELLGWPRRRRAAAEGGGWLTLEDLLARGAAGQGQPAGVDSAPQGVVDSAPRGGASQARVVAAPASAAAAERRAAGLARPSSCVEVLRRRRPAPTRRSSVAPAVFASWDEVAAYLRRQQIPEPGVGPAPDQDAVLCGGLCHIEVRPPGHRLINWDPFAYAVARLAAWARALGPMAFKIGIAADARDRFFNQEYGYRREGLWHFMDQILEGRADECRQLEIALIAACGQIAGCYNDKPGGEGVNPARTHMCVVYAVVSAAAEGVGLQSAVRRRRKTEV